METRSQNLVAPSCFLFVGIILSMAGCGQPSNPTVRLWNDANRVLAGTNYQQSLRASDCSARLASAANRLRGLSSQGADPVIVDWVHRTANGLDSMAQLHSRAALAGIMLESIIRGASGDPYGTTLEYMAAYRQLDWNIGMLRQEGYRYQGHLQSQFGNRCVPCGL